LPPGEGDSHEEAAKNYPAEVRFLALSKGGCVQNPLVLIRFSNGDCRTRSAGPGLDWSQSRCKRVSRGSRWMTAQKSSPTGQNAP